MRGAKRPAHHEIRAPHPASRTRTRARTRTRWPSGSDHGRISRRGRSYRRPRALADFDADDAAGEVTEGVEAAPLPGLRSARQEGDQVALAVLGLSHLLQPDD